MSQKVSEYKLAGLRRYLLQRAFLRFRSGRENTQVTALGKSMVIDCRDTEQKYFAADCTREPENYMLYAAIADGGLAKSYIDVGANCGLVAASALKHFGKLVLIEPNPKLASHLRKLFDGHSQVSVMEKAIVGKGDVGKVTLQVPVGSSGLASLNPLNIAYGHGDFLNYEVEATTLEKVCAGIDIADAYVKIDVEGQEEAIISSSADVFRKYRPLVGFEALSIAHAQKCASHFHDCTFYHARFAFMEAGGSLKNSKARIAHALLFGSTVEVLREPDLNLLSHSNFSQLIAVPLEKQKSFEAALANASAARSATQISNLRFLG